MIESTLITEGAGVLIKIRSEVHLDQEFPYYALYYEGENVLDENGTFWYTGWTWRETRKFTDPDVRHRWILSVIEGS